MIYEEQQAEQRDRIVCLDENGDVKCVTAEGGVTQIPTEFKSALQALSADLQLALDCIDIFGGVPLPVVRAILCNMEPAQTALDLALKCRQEVEDGKTARS